MGGVECPAVLFALQHHIFFFADERLDGDDQTFLQLAFIRGVVVIVDHIRLIVQGETYAVAAEIAYQLQPVAGGGVFDGTADVIEGLAVGCGGDGVGQGFFGGTQQALSHFIAAACQKGCAVITEVAVKLGRDIYIYHITGPDDAVAGDAVGDLLVDADAGVAREIVNRHGGGGGAVFGQQPASQLIQLFGGHTRTAGGHHITQHDGTDAADFLQLLQFLVGLDYHSYHSLQTAHEAFDAVAGFDQIFH